MFNNKKLLKNTGTITKTGLALSFGSQLSNEEYSQKAVSNISKQLPTVGSIQGGAAVVDSLKLLDPRRLRKK